MISNLHLSFRMPLKIGVTIRDMMDLEMEIKMAITNPNVQIVMIITIDIKIRK